MFIALHMCIKASRHYPSSRIRHHFPLTKAKTVSHPMNKSDTRYIKLSIINLTKERSPCQL